MLQQSDSLLLDKLVDHITKNGTDSIEALVSLANVLQSEVVKQDLLYDEDGDGFAELTTSFHDTETKRDDFGGKKEVDDFAAVILDKGTDDAEGGQAQIFKGTRFGGRV